MKKLLGLYPPSWRSRYGDEMAALLEQIPVGTQVALDLVVGAAIAYAGVVRRNRLLTSATAFLHAVSVAVLLQAIAFTALILGSQQSLDSTFVAVGPVRFVSVFHPAFASKSSLLTLTSASLGDTLATIGLTFVLAVGLALLITGPMLIRRSAR